MSRTQSQFVSLRWRLSLPITLVVMVGAMTGIYLLTSSAAAGVSSNSAANILERSYHSISQQMSALQQSQQRTALTVAFFDGMQEAFRSGNADGVQEAVQARALNAGTDSLVLSNLNGHVVLGYLRARQGNTYGQISVFDAPFLRLADPADEAITGLASAGDDLLLTTGISFSRNGVPMGYVLAGQRVSSVLESLKPSAMTNAILYDEAGEAVASTFNSNTLPLASLSRPSTPESLYRLDIDGQRYQALNFPFEYGGSTLGTLSLLMPDTGGMAASVRQQLDSLVLALLAGLAIIAVFVASNWVGGRSEKVRRTAESLARGHSTARSHLKPTDEIGAAGYALDKYADYAQGRQDMLRNSLRRQRRENERLIAVLEALPDGVIVQDAAGRLVLINEKARQMIGSNRELRSNADLQEMLAAVTDYLGPALAPGIYNLGDVQQVRIDQRVLSVQAAAVTTITQQRIATVIVLRDITESLEREAARQRAIEQLDTEIQQPLSQLAHSRPARDFSNEMQRYSSALQRMILELQDLNDNPSDVLGDQQRPILLDALVWAVADDWRQVAQAQNLTLHVIIEKSGLYVLGQERRLRWAIGNIVDNAIKYTPPGGALTLEIRDDESRNQAHLRVRDNGVGIAREEVHHVTTRFYRGKPVTELGRVISVPGSGQGLSTAKQIFEGHGGRLEIRSKQGVGTAVSFTLPLTDQHSYTLPQVAAQLENKTVLPVHRDENATG